MHARRGGIGFGGALALPMAASSAARLRPKKSSSHERSAARAEVEDRAGERRRIDAVRRDALAGAASTSPFSCGSPGRALDADVGGARPTRACATRRFGLPGDGLVDQRVELGSPKPCHHSAAIGAAAAVAADTPSARGRASAVGSARGGVGAHDLAQPASVECRAAAVRA